METTSNIELHRDLIAALEAGKKLDVNRILSHYKTFNGATNFPKLFEINSEHRLPMLAKYDYRKAAMWVCGGVTMALDSMNLVRGMNENQVYDLTDFILDSSNEDNLALEDLMLFLQKLTRGEYGKLYESMDIPKFMEMFEIYREERFQAMRGIREEQVVQFNAIPVNDRLIDMFGSERDKQREALKDYLIKKSKDNETD
jgi:hypothetical protein